MIKFTLGVKNLPPEAVNWFASTGFEDPQTHSVPPIGGFRNILPGERYSWEWSEANAQWPTFIYVRGIDVSGNQLMPPNAPPRQYWDIRAGTFTYDYATSEVIKKAPWWPVALGAAGVVGLVLLVSKKR